MWHPLVCGLIWDGPSLWRRGPTCRPNSTCLSNLLSSDRSCFAHGTSLLLAWQPWKNLPKPGSTGHRHNLVLVLGITGSYLPIRFWLLYPFTEVVRCRIGAGASNILPLDVPIVPDHVLNEDNDILLPSKTYPEHILFGLIYIEQVRLSW